MFKKFIFKKSKWRAYILKRYIFLCSQYCKGISKTHFGLGFSNWLLWAVAEYYLGRGLPFELTHAAMLGSLIALMCRSLPGSLTGGTTLQETS